jgi:hypothetical protein
MLKLASYKAGPFYNETHEDQGKPPPFEEVCKTLEKIFNKAQILKEEFPNSRKVAAFYIVNHLCEVFFKAKQYRTCLRFISWVK